MKTTRILTGVGMAALAAGSLLQAVRADSAQASCEVLYVLMTLLF